MSQTGPSNSNPPVLDPVVQQVAKVYAKALLGAAQNTDQLEPIVEEFDELIRDVIDPHPDFEKLLSSAILSHEEKVGILQRTLGDQLSPLFFNFLKVLSAHGRLDCLRAIHQSMHELYDEMRGIARVGVRTAVPLDEQLAQRLRERLEEALNLKPRLQPTTDPDLIGGIVLTLGDRVLDASISAQLEQIRNQMIDRSVHEIQSRRDHFRTTTGD